MNKENSMQATTKQKQKVYEHLLTLNCPDLLAACIAGQTNVPGVQHVLNSGDIHHCVMSAFPWYDAKEGAHFWVDLSKDIAWGTEVVADEKPDEIVSSTSSEDREVLVSSARLIDFDTSSWLVLSQPVQVETKVYTWWTTIKLFFGKIFYKV